MTYYPELSRFSYLEDRGPAILNVGWLDPPNPYAKGDVSAADIEALERLMLHTWQPMFSKGWHDCPFCGRGPIERHIGGVSTILGTKILFVPDGDRMFAAPSLILHYIEEHGYRPPDEFLEAARRVDATAPAYRAECERLWAAGTPPKRGFWSSLFGRKARS